MLVKSISFTLPYEIPVSKAVVNFLRYRSRAEKLDDMLLKQLLCNFRTFFLINDSKKNT